MSFPDYPLSVARDRFGLWLHVVGLSFREVVAALPHCFATDALLVYDDEQLDYATSSYIDERRREGLARDQLVEEIARLEDAAFWNTVDPLFENDTATVWPIEYLGGMVRVQGSPGGCFGVTPVAREAVAELANDFVYEHPSNVDARCSFLSTDDSATSVFVTDEADLAALVRCVVAKAVAVSEGATQGLDEVVAGLRPLLEGQGVDIRARGDEAESATHRTATVAVGQWNLHSQWPLLWRDVPVREIGWDGHRWALSEVRHEPGRRFVSPIRLVGEVLHWTGHLTRYAVVFGLPLAAAALAWVTTGWLGGLLALLVAIVLWPRFVLGTDWHALRHRRAEEEALRGKYQ